MQQVGQFHNSRTLHHAVCSKDPGLPGWLLTLLCCRLVCCRSSGATTTTTAQKKTRVPLQAEPGLVTLTGHMIRHRHCSNKTPHNTWGGESSCYSLFSRSAAAAEAAEAQWLLVPDAAAASTHCSATWRLHSVAPLPGGLGEGGGDSEHPHLKSTSCHMTQPARHSAVLMVFQPCHTHTPH